MFSYDLLMLVVLLGCTVFGAWKGMAWQLASLGSLVVSYLAALKFSDQLAPAFGNEGPWNRVVAMLIVYCCTAIAVWMAFRVVARLIDRVKLREFDRQLGALFGAAKGVLLCLVITFFAVSLSETARGMVRASRSGHYMTMLLDRAHPLIPPDVHQVLGPYFHQLQEGPDPNARPDEGHSHPPHHPDGVLAGNSQAKRDSTANSANGWPAPGRDEPEPRNEFWRPSSGSLDRLPADRTARGSDRDGLPPGARDSSPPGSSGWDNLRNILDGIRQLNDLGRGESNR